MEFGHALQPNGLEKESVTQHSKQLMKANNQQPLEMEDNKRRDWGIFDYCFLCLEIQQLGVTQTIEEEETKGYDDWMTD